MGSEGCGLGLVCSCEDMLHGCCSEVRSDSPEKCTRHVMCRCIYGVCVLPLACVEDAMRLCFLLCCNRWIERMDSFDMFDIVLDGVDGRSTRTT